MCCFIYWSRAVRSAREVLATTNAHAQTFVQCTFNGLQKCQQCAVNEIKGDVSCRHTATSLLSPIHIQGIYEQIRQHRPSTERNSDFHKSTITHSPAVSCVVSETLSFPIISVLTLIVMLLPALYIHMWGWQLKCQHEIHRTILLLQLAFWNLTSWLVGRIAQSV